MLACFMVPLYVFCFTEETFLNLKLLKLDDIMKYQLGRGPVAPLNVKTTLNVKTAKCEKPNNR